MKAKQLSELLAPTYGAFLTLSQMTIFWTGTSLRSLQMKFDENGRKFSKQVGNTVGKGEIALYEQFLAPLAIGQRAYVMVCCPSCVRPSVRVLTFSLNIFFSETTYRILVKFHRNVPAMVLFRIS